MIASTQPPAEVWRIADLRRSCRGNKKIPHTQWRSSREAVDAHVEWLNAGFGELVSVTKYVIVEDRS